MVFKDGDPLSATDGVATAVVRAVVIAAFIVAVRVAPLHRFPFPRLVVEADEL